MLERTLGQTAAIIMIEEIMPRAKRYGFFLHEAIAGLLFRAEHEGKITRREVRKYLDEIYG